MSPRRKSVPLSSRERAVIQALHVLAAWHEGPTVDGRFDEPAAAKIARETLLVYYGITGPPEPRRGST